MAARRRKNQPENPVGFEGRTKDQERLALRRKVKMFYDLQRLRMQSEGRVTEKAEGAEIQLHEGDLQVLGNRATELHAAEKNALADVEDHLKMIPFFEKVLSDKERYRGIGPTMAGVILSEFDINRADTPSDFWMYAGLAPVPAKRCKVCQGLTKVTNAGLEHVAQQITCAKKGQVLSDAEVFESGQSMRPQKGEKLPYNAFLKTKLIGVLGPVMLKVGSPWTQHYKDYKLRKQTQNWGMSDGHRHNAAIRYMIKMLLLDIWTRWREFENLPVRPSYHQEKQGGHGFQQMNAQ